MGPMTHDPWTTGYQNVGPMFDPPKNYENHWNLCCVLSVDDSNFEQEVEITVESEGHCVSSSI